MYFAPYAYDSSLLLFRSLGCTIIELFTGKPPYADLIPMTTLFRIVEDECPPLPTTTSEVRLACKYHHTTQIYAID